VGVVGGRCVHFGVRWGCSPIITLYVQFYHCCVWRNFTPF